MPSKFQKMFQEADVTAEMLEAVAAGIEEHLLAGGERDPELAMWTAFRVLKGKVASPHTITAVLFRMDALSAHIVAGDLREWIAGGADDGGILINVALFEAAAKAPLRLSSRRGVRPKFNLNEFKRLALAAAETDGAVQ